MSEPGGWAPGDPPLGSREFHTDERGHVDAARPLRPMTTGEALDLWEIERALARASLPSDAAQIIPAAVRAFQPYAMGYEVTYKVGPSGPHEPLRGPRCWPYDNTVLDEMRALLVGHWSAVYAEELSGLEVLPGVGWRLQHPRKDVRGVLAVQAWNLRVDVAGPDGYAYDFPPDIPTGARWLRQAVEVADMGHDVLKTCGFSELEKYVGAGRTER